MDPLCYLSCIVLRWTSAFCDRSVRCPCVIIESLLLRRTMFKNVKRNSLAVLAPTDVLKRFRCVAVTFKLTLLMCRLFPMIGGEGGRRIDGIKTKKNASIKERIQLAAHRKCSFLSSIRHWFVAYVWFRLRYHQILMPRKSKYFKERHVQRLSREIREGISNDRLRDPFIITWATRGKRKGGTRKVIAIKASLKHNEILQCMWKPDKTGRLENIVFNRAEDEIYKKMRACNTSTIIDASFFATKRIFPTLTAIEYSFVFVRLSKFITSFVLLRR